MKSKLNPIFIIVGLFLFKVVLIDNVRHLGHSTPDNDRHIASETRVANNNLKPIR